MNAFTRTAAFTIGRKNSGGTSLEKGLVVGAKMAGPGMEQDLRHP